MRYTVRRMKLLKRLLAVPLIAAVLLGQGCTKGTSPETAQLSKHVVVNIWGVVDDLDAYQTIFNDFHKEYPYAELRFKRFRLEEYEDELLNAMAEDRGPDIFMIHNTWVNKYMPKMQPQPKSVKAAIQISSGSGTNAKVVYQTQTTQTVSPGAVKNDFADFVAQDALRPVNVSTDPGKKVFEQRVVALPMSADTLSLFYNKDLLNSAGIPTPPETWDQFQAQVKKLVRQGDDGSIVRAGAGIGLGSNVERSPDILALLMMQNGAVMSDEDGDPTFARTPADLQGERDHSPGLEALRFYSEFANPAKEVYTWNAKQPNSLDAFIHGTSAFFLGYSYQLPSIKASAPKLNLGITKVPQIAGNPEVNIANYWMWTVSKKSASGDLAWLLVDRMTGKDEVTKYLTAAKRPAARKALLSDQLEDENIGIFASQVLTAKTWYRGIDPKTAENALIELMDAAPAAPDDDELQKMLQISEEKVGQTIR
jgi:ABC-type glycerol-3-phosphate transport system substrate-binding protein